MAIDPNHEDPPRALAIALMEENKLSEAESIIRDALRRLERSKCWQLHLLLARLFIQRGDESSEHEYYEESLKEIIKAIKLRESDPEPYFYAGIVRAKLQDYSGAYWNFKACLNRDKYHFEAERNARRVKNLLKTEGIRRKGLLAGYVILLISLMLLLLLWFFYFQTFFQTVKISETTLTVMTPILLGLVVVGFLLPELIQIKLPGLEAELVQPKETISSGPKANIGFGSSSPSVSSGPR
jgi:tetratricopeptide (TPR) repeat protein